MYAINVSAEAQAASLRWIISMSETDKWNLSLDEMALLLGLPANTLQNILEKVNIEPGIELPGEIVERLSHLLGIWKCLQLIAPTNRIDLAYAGFNRPIDNEIFEGKSIKELLLDHNETETFYVARSYLEAAVS